MRWKSRSKEIHINGNNVVNYIIKNIIALVICIGAVRGFSYCEGAAVCEAKTVSDKEEVEKFVTAYYEAHNKKDVETLTNYAEDSESFSEYIIRLKVSWEYGVQKYGHIDVDVYPLSDGEHWLAYVCHEMIVEDFDVGLPGAVAELVGRDQEGNLVIETYSDMEIDEEILREIREILVSDEVQESMNEQQRKYNDIIYENADILEWENDLQEAVTRALAEEYYAQDQKEKDDRYLVKKGDCLWNIAQEQLGDGMKWGSIYQANKAVIGDDPDLLYIGIELQIN